jgi:hypothetical protein
MTATLPPELQDLFQRTSVAELVTIDDHGRPVASSVSPSYRPGGDCIDVATDQIPAPQVALLFAETPPMVLVQGTAQSEGALHVRPERVYVWEGDGADEPRLFDAHLEEVRSGHNEEPEIGHADPEGGEGLWDDRLDNVQQAVLACVGPDGFPFAVRLPVQGDRQGRMLLFPRVPLGMPVEPGPGCVHCPDGSRVQGDLIPRAEGWTLVPHAVVAG